MTTVAYKDGVLAADSCIVEDGGSRRVPGGMKKIVEIDGDVYSFCGSVSQFLACIKALAENQELPTWEGSTILVKIDLKGRVWSNEGNGPWIKADGKYAAFGSGSSYAYGAMAVGASAVDAVKAASKFDTSTGGPVRHVNIKDKSRV